MERSQIKEVLLKGISALCCCMCCVSLFTINKMKVDQMEVDHFVNCPSSVSISIATWQTVQMRTSKPSLQLYPYLATTHHFKFTYQPQILSYFAHGSPNHQITNSFHLIPTPSPLSQTSPQTSTCGTSYPATPRGTSAVAGESAALHHGGSFRGGVPRRRSPPAVGGENHEVSPK